ncbi:cobalt-zinc-cadmium efflux system outer membrane protein [Mucilaginibacter oryzae]|uniref:Cobalt-zinc-cadmium efflux system outer membrane protein n=1 Tax=Mucilaginibacter oryzae TaxID=468058 RepID=A0A316HLV1_9SPHI|nr:TolC family protein [Mucilaginibacter oryzae]PWK79195.1 cobalt-zinc-cadmium efflux system outer membrane protein [Mucilaginibacter oryzae]
MHRKFVIVLSSIQLWCMAVPGARAQAQAPNSDTLKVNIKQIEEQFLKNNLTLIAEKYNIDNAEAQVTTAKLFANPDFNFQNGILNDTHNAYKNQSAGISQLFTTAGKRNKNIRLAQIGVAQARYQFFDLLRTLRFTIRTDFYTIYYNQQSAMVYDLEIGSLRKTLSSFKEQFAKGNIAQKEVLRIQSQLYSLQAEYNSLVTGIDATEAELKMLIKAPPQSYIVPLVDPGFANTTSATSIPYSKLLDSAYVNRYDLKNAQITVDYNKINLALQKATAVPDITFSLGYDKYGSFNNNYVGGGIDFNLPFFNRNQGGIKQARIAIDQSKVQLENQQNQVAMDLATSYKEALRYEDLYNSFDPGFKSDFTHLISEVYKNYLLRNIGLLEFIDFYDSFKTNTVQFNNIQLNRVTSLEQLNYVTGTPFFNQH